MQIKLDEAFERIDEHFSPRIAFELNGQHVKLAKLKGTFDWHRHDNGDELFLVHRGRFVMEFRDRTVEVGPGEMILVPRGVEHRPVAEQEAEVILFEPAGTLNTGNVESHRTVRNPARLQEET